MLVLFVEAQICQGVITIRVKTCYHLRCSFLVDLEISLSTFLQKGLITFILCSGWEAWAPWWEAEDKGRQREAGAANQSLQCPTSIFTSSLYIASCIFCTTRTSWRKQVDVLCWLPWCCNVAIYATSCSRHHTGSCSPSTGCLSWRARLNIHLPKDCSLPILLWLTYNYASVLQCAWFWSPRTLCMWTYWQYLRQLVFDVCMHYRIRNVTLALLPCGQLLQLSKMH